MAEYVRQTPGLVHKRFHIACALHQPDQTSVDVTYVRSYNALLLERNYRLTSPVSEQKDYSQNMLNLPDSGIVPRQLQPDTSLSFSLALLCDNQSAPRVPQTCFAVVS